MYTLSPLKLLNGVLVSKDDKVLTNYNPKVVGVVKEHSCIVGYLINHHPIDCTDENEKRNWNTYLTVEQTSSQRGIIDHLKRKHALYHAPHKEQYLPEYFRKIISDYAAEEDVTVVTPCKKLGLIQDTSTFAVYAYQGKDEIRYLKLENSKITEYKGVDLGFVDAAPSDIIDVNVQSLRDVVEFTEKYFTQNRSAALVTLGAAMCCHYSSLKKMREGIPVPILYGPPGATKSAMASLAFSCIGVFNKTQDSTYAGILKKVSSAEQTVVWWEDVDDFNSFEKVTMLIYNQGRRDTAAMKLKEPPSSIPIATSNGFWHLAKSKTNLIRTLGRVILIPYESSDRREKKNYKELLHFDKELLDARKKAINAFGWILSMKNLFESYIGDQGQDLISDILANVKVDERTAKNYGLVLFGTLKIMEACNYSKEEIEGVFENFMERVDECHSKIIAEVKLDGTSSANSVKDVLLNIIKHHMQEEQIVFRGKSRCKCKDVLFVDLKKAEVELRHIKEIKELISNEDLGCVGRNIKVKKNGDDRQTTLGFHLDLYKLPEEFLCNELFLVDVDQVAETQTKDTEEPQQLQDQEQLQEDLEKMDSSETQLGSASETTANNQVAETQTKDTEEPRQLQDQEQPQKDLEKMDSSETQLGSASETMTNRKCNKEVKRLHDALYKEKTGKRVRRK